MIRKTKLKDGTTFLASGSYTHKYKPTEMTEEEKEKIKYRLMPDAELESKLGELKTEFKRREDVKQRIDDMQHVCKAEKHQLATGWKLLILATFLMLLWTLANPHYVTAQRIYISKPHLLYWGFYTTELQRDVVTGTLCTNETHISAVLGRTTWVTGGECAWVEDYPKLIMFGVG